METAGLDKTDVFFQHVSSVQRYIHEAFPTLRVIMWDDMFREASADAIAGRCSGYSLHLHRKHHTVYSGTLQSVFSSFCISYLKEARDTAAVNEQCIAIITLT